MIKVSLAKVLAGIGVSLTLFTACVDDSDLLAPPPPGDHSFTEEFDTLKSAWDRGWRYMNRSNPLGMLWVDDPTGGLATYPFDDLKYYQPTWHQGDGYDWYHAYSSNSTNGGYVASSWASFGGFPIPTDPELEQQFLNNWLVSPEVLAKNGDKIIFYTRCDTTARLQVRLNKNSESFLNVGRSITDPGDFTSLLLDINPSYNPTEADHGYPQDWTRFEATVYGLDKPTKVRFGFRSMIPDGFTGSIWPTTAAADVYYRLNKSLLGIDKVQFVSK